MGADVGREPGRILHHLAPVLGAQPGIVVHALDAVVDGAHRPALRDRRRKVRVVG
jgi:hypothetical protein